MENISHSIYLLLYIIELILLCKHDRGTVWLSDQKSFGEAECESDSKESTQCVMELGPITDCKVRPPELTHRFILYDSDKSESSAGLLLPDCLYIHVYMLLVLAVEGWGIAASAS